MEENTTQTEETTATENEISEETESGMTQAEESEFESAFAEEDATEAKEESTEAKVDPEAENKPAKKEPQKEESRVAVQGREYTAAEVEGLLSRVTELQGAANASPERAVVERLAALAGVDAETFMQNAEDTIMKNQIAARMAQLTEQGVEEEMARHIAELEAKNAAAENVRALETGKSQSTQTAQQELKAKFDAQVAEFERMYPDVKEPPDEVFDEMAKTGVSPVVAYQHYLLREKDKELTAARQEQKNKSQTTGSVKGREAEAEDPFVVELMK